MALMLALLDAAVVLAAVTGTLVWTSGGRGPGIAVAAAHALAIALAGLAVASYEDLYDLRRVRRLREAAPRLARAVAAGTLVVVAAHAALGRCAIGPLPIVAAGAVALVLALAARAAVDALLDAKPHRERVLMVGGGPLAHELIAEIHARPHLRQRIVGIVDDRAGTPLGEYPRLGSLKDLARIVEEVKPQRVIVALASRRGSMPLKALLALRVHGTAVEDGVEVYERLTGKIAIEALTPSSLIFSRHFRAFRADLALARALSLPLVALALVLLSPLLALIALAIKLDSSGPVLFVQERVGRGGRLFKLIKFRTMRPARGATSEWARDNDDRMTRVGRWLRRFRLDELPQLINIVKGDMNLVGPRPHPVSNVPLFEIVLRNTPDCGETIPYYALRSMVRPGLSGWAQVRYQYANDLEEEIEKMRYDLYYIKHMSAWLDLGILFATMKIVLRGRESAPSAPASSFHPAAVHVTPPAPAALRLAGSATRPAPEPVVPLAAASAAAFEPAASALPMAVPPPVAGA
jgi:exopolysaccharide biosynthesis polyprenyl glycosylphosphotransferase